jgi:hypothetical protein
MRFTFLLGLFFFLLACKDPAPVVTHFPLVDSLTEWTAHRSYPDSMLRVAFNNGNVDSALWIAHNPSQWEAQMELLLLLDLNKPNLWGRYTIDTLGYDSLHLVSYHANDIKQSVQSLNIAISPNGKLLYFMGEIQRNAYFSKSTYKIKADLSLPDFSIYFEQQYLSRPPVTYEVSLQPWSL